jgi:enoyl-CoA hydratase
MVGEYVQVEWRSRIAVVTIERPKALNALNAQVLDELESAFTLLAERAQPVVVNGGGGKAFVAGADIASMKDMDAMAAAAFAAKGQRVFSMVERHPAPVIAAVHGFALGGGCELVLACDLALLSPTAVLGQPEVKLGVIPGFGGTQRLVRRVGTQRARELCYTGRLVKADEAVAIGLGLRIEDPVLDAAIAVAEQIATMGPVAVRLCKQAILDTDGLPLDRGLQLERQCFALCFTTADQKEGMDAFIQKRAAAFSGN